MSKSFLYNCEIVPEIAKLKYQSLRLLKTQIDSE